MLVGDLVQIIPHPGQPGLDPGQEVFAGLLGIVILDHSPMRPPEVGRVFDVMWNNGTIEDMYAHELEVIDEGR